MVMLLMALEAVHISFLFHPLLLITTIYRCWWKRLILFHRKRFSFLCTLHCKTWNWMIYLKLTGSLQSVKEQTTFGACINYSVIVEEKLHRWWCDFLTNYQGTKYGHNLVTGVRFPRSRLLGTWEKNLLHLDKEFMQCNLTPYGQIRLRMKLSSLSHDRVAKIIKTARFALVSTFLVPVPSSENQLTGRSEVQTV